MTSLFTNVPLEYTIDVILRRIYDNKEVKSDIPITDMKTLLLLSTKNVHFTFNKETYQQIDGVAMGSPLGPIIAGIFIVELETNIVPTLSEHLCLWKHYVDDTLCYVKRGSIDIVHAAINNFYPNKDFTFEEQRSNMIAFLDVLLVCKASSIETAVFRKSTHTDLYISWNSFSPEIWKKRTLKLLIKRAYMVCSNEDFLQMELDHLKNTFTEINNFPVQVVVRKLVADDKPAFLTPIPTKPYKKK